MAISTDWANALLQQALNGVALPANFTTTNVYLSLHTADPGIGGTQNTNEVSYTGYARIAIVRNTTGGWTVSGKVGSNTAAALFGVMTAGTGGIVTYGAVGELTSGAGKLYATGLLTQSINIQTNVQPNFPIGAVTLTFV
jgi:hypothetical protein